MPRDLQTYGAQNEKNIMRHCALCVYTQCCQRLDMSWTLKNQPNASCHCAHADVQPPEQELKVGESTTKHSWRWKILRSLCTQKPQNHTLEVFPWPTSPSHLAKQSDTPAESDSKPPASVHHVALAHRFQDVPCVSCDSCQRHYKIFTLWRLMALDSYVQLHSKWFVLDRFFVLRGRASQMHSFHSTFLCEFCVLVWLLVL